MKTISETEFAFHVGDEFVIYELEDSVDDLSRSLLEQSMDVLLREYDRPFGIIFPRGHGLAIDLLAARELMEERLPNLVAVANVTADPSTQMSIEYEKTIIDQIPVEYFPGMSEAVGWITKIVREKRSGV